MPRWIPRTLLLLTLLPPTAWAAEPPEEPKKETEEKNRLKVYDQIDVTGRASDLVGIADSATEGVTGQVDLAKRPILRPGGAPGDGARGHRHAAQRRAARRTSTSCAASTSTTAPTSRSPSTACRVNMPTPRPRPGLHRPQLPHPRAGRRRPVPEGPLLRRRRRLLRRRRRRHRLRRRRSTSRSITLTAGGRTATAALLVADSKQLAGGELLGAHRAACTTTAPGTCPRTTGSATASLRFSRGDAANGFTVTAMGYTGSWDSTDQIPRRAVDRG